MAKSAVTQWDTTAANNTDIDGTNIAENCPPSGINDAIRSIMSQVATMIGGGLALAADFLAGTATTKFLAPKTIFDAAAYVTLTDATTVAVDLSTGFNFTVTLGGNRTLGTPTNLRPGQSGVIEVVQDATGARALAFASGWKIVGGVPSLSSTAGAVDVLAYIVRTTSTVQLYPNKGIV